MVAEIDHAQAAYDNWRREHKLMLKVYTDEETFKLGFYAGVKKASDDMLELMKKTKEEKPCASTKSTTKKTKSSDALTGKTKP